MDNIKEIKKGSMTIEAAFIVPMIVMLLFLMITLAMHVHNRVWYTAAAGEALITASTQGVHQNQKAGEILLSKMEKRMKQQGFPMGDISAKTVVTGDCMKVNVDITSISVPMLPVWKDKISEKMTLIRPVSWIRKVYSVNERKGEIDGN